MVGTDPTEQAMDRASKTIIWVGMFGMMIAAFAML